MITNKLKFHNRMIVSPFFQLDLRSARSMMGVVNVSNEISARASRAINIMLTYSENSAGALERAGAWSREPAGLPPV